MPKPPLRRGEPASDAAIERMNQRLREKVAERVKPEQMGLCAAPLRWERIDTYAEGSHCGNYRVSKAFVHGQAHYSAWAKGPTGAFTVIDNKHPLDQDACKRSCQEHADRQVQLEEARNG